MVDIRIHYKDEVNIKIECDESIARELSDYFTFTMPNYQSTKQHWKFGWNGKIKLFKDSKRELLRGLIPYIYEFASLYSYKVSCDPRLKKSSNITSIAIDNFAKTLQLQSGGHTIAPRDYQSGYVAAALSHRRLTILSPTSSGKSGMMYLIVRALEHKLDNDKKLLIIVPTVNLVEQLHGDFKDYSSKNRWNVDRTCAKIYEGHDKHPHQNIILSTWQSLFQMPKEYFHQFYGVIGDEAHLYSAKSIQYILENCINAKYRIGLSGTLKDSKVHKLLIEGSFGLIHSLITTRELMDRGDVANLDIKCVLLKHDPVEIKDYQDEISYLISNEKRNRFICKLALSMKNNTLVLFQRIEKHGLILEQIINELNDGSKNIYVVHGGVDVKIREEIRAILEKEDNAVILASYGTWSTGANIKNLHNVIFASPYKDRIKILQSIGRSIRLNDNKDKANLYDISDDLRMDDKKNITLNHFIARLKIYHEEKFDHKLFKIRI